MQALATADFQPRRRQDVIIGTAGDPRVVGFQAARARAGLPPADELDYRDLVANPERAAARVPPSARVRIDSPGRHPRVLDGLMRLGAEACGRAGEHHLAPHEIATYLEDRGRLIPPRQLYRGMERVLDALARRAEQTGGGIALVPDPAFILLAFDKTACREHLAARGVSVPAALPPIASFEALLAAMRDTRHFRVFVKLRYGSAAAGTVALATSRQGLRAVSTVEMTEGPAGLHLYNTRNVRTYSHAADIARLIDALAPLGLHVEAWIPKASVDGKVADLRVLVVGGEPRLRVLRKSRHPITNLHLGGERGPADSLLSRMPAASAAALDETCRSVALAMPGALQLGIDVAVAGGLLRHYVLEVNAFGDLLNGITTEDGLDAYDLQVRAMGAAA